MTARVRVDSGKEEERATRKDEKNGAAAGSSVLEREAEVGRRLTAARAEETKLREQIEGRRDAYQRAPASAHIDGQEPPSMEHIEQSDRRIERLGQLVAGLEKEPRALEPDAHAERLRRITAASAEIRAAIAANIARGNDLAAQGKILTRERQQLGMANEGLRGELARLGERDLGLRRRLAALVAPR